MAYVGITRQLLMEVDDKIRGMGLAEQRLVDKKEAELVISGTDELVVRAAWGENAVLYPTIPIAWCREAERGSVQVSYVDLGGKKASSPLIDCVFTPLLRLPPTSQTYNYRLSLNYAHWEDLPPALATEVLRKEEQDGIKHRWDAIGTKLAAFLKECPSLNKAIKLWPQVAMYIPAPYLARVQKNTEKAERKSGAEALASMDTDALVAAAVLAGLVMGEKK